MRSNKVENRHLFNFLNVSWSGLIALAGAMMPAVVLAADIIGTP